MKQYSQDVTKQQHKRARNIKIQPGDIVMLKLHTPLGNSNKLSPKFKGPYKVEEPDSGNKFKIQHLETSDISVRHADELKQTNMNELGENTIIGSEEIDSTEKHTAIETETDSHTASENESHACRMKLRSNRKQVFPLTCMNETSLENEFYENVDELLDELNIDCYSFYR